MDYESFMRIESIFSELLEAMRRDLAANMIELDTYIDHGEYGLALETAVAILDPKSSIALGQRGNIRDLAKQMGISDEPWMVEFLESTSSDQARRT